MSTPHYGRRRVAAIFALAAVQALTLAGGVQGAAPSADTADTSGFDFSQRLDLPPLLDSREWVLVGTKLDNGACRYKYPDGEQVVPGAGSSGPSRSTWTSARS